jgi:hypothetical protein
MSVEIPRRRRSENRGAETARPKLDDRQGESLNFLMIIASHTSLLGGLREERVKTRE